jgi:hypothetical protein
METDIFKTVIDLDNRLKELKNNNFSNLELNHYVELNNTHKSKIRFIRYNINEINECPVCYEKKALKNNFDCIHGLCITCYNQWSNYDNTCPMCRKK